MRGVCIDVQLSRNTGSLQGEIHEDAVLRRADDIVPAVDEKKWRRICWEVEARSKLVLILRLEVARIHRNREIGSTTDFVNIIDWIVGSLIEARRRRRNQMAARREPDHADALGIDAPFRGAVAHEADRALSILERASGRLTFGLIGAARHTVLQDDAGDANGVEPGSYLFAFELPVQVPVAAARAYQHRGSTLSVRERSINSYGRSSDGGNEPGGLGDFDLLAIQPR